ncbi:hypothetical protein H6F43_16235 [Leptolyngbya sp. FACHB-36]|uniref:hypothetical protein n=1 Tax=Leptolyngbya sp. FACHB-36 TaxID=2692808 RepID=UPI00168130DE|nr:hypothetical protein [Leptolyngbya sp. FACHB-36]MBD2021730.1 hypothetical protein [Leptolyngbya sp. FACHB-36]
MSNHVSADLLGPATIPWDTFEDILRRLHKEQIYLHPHQLAEFLVYHGLPVDLCYVPKHLKQKAQKINDNYQGDWARQEAISQPHSLFSFE